MKAAFYTQTGPPEVIQYGDLPDPRPGPGQCLVRVAAVDVNPIDTYIRAGMVPIKLNFPTVPGFDLAGTVVECGPEAVKFRPGDRVWGTNQSLGRRPGTSSELAAVEECFLYPIPAGATENDMAALSLVAVTAQLGLVRDTRLRPGEVLFVNGGTGGVGSSVVQMAKALGARVITTAGSDDKVKICQELGADLVINYRRESVDEAIRSHAPTGVNVWWETLREPDFERAVPLLAMRARMVIMAGRDARPAFPVGPFYVKDCSLFGFAMFNAPAEQLEAAARDINRWVTEGKLRARIDRILPLSEAASAHRLQEENTIQKKGTLAGKIVLRP
jgi:NADPH2:quinone reductase